VNRYDGAQPHDRAAAARLGAPRFVHVRLLTLENLFSKICLVGMFRLGGR
jgi:hypothetical protein